MHKMLVPLLVGLCACSDGETEFSWGEASQSLSSDWCEVRERCLDLGQFDTCVRHNMHHLCELGNTCEVPVPEAQALAVNCTRALEVIDSPEHAECISVVYGFLPPACDELLQMMPASQ